MRREIKLPLDTICLAYPIPDPLDRNAYNALNTCDAMGYDMLDHLRVPITGWCTREDNRSADAIVRRLGYKPGETVLIDGHNYTFYRLDQETWRSRRERLERGDQVHPSAIGDAFVTLEHPVTPRVPTEAE